MTCEPCPDHPMLLLPVHESAAGRVLCCYCAQERRQAAYAKQREATRQAE